MDNRRKTTASTPRAPRRESSASRLQPGEQRVPCLDDADVGVLLPVDNAPTELCAEQTGHPNSVRRFPHSSKSEVS